MVAFSRVARPSLMASSITGINCSILSEVSQFPWVGALLVTPKMRRKGIGTLLLRSVMKQARKQGYYTLYAATESAGNLFIKEGWVYDDLLLMEGKEIIIYRYCV